MRFHLVVLVGKHRGQEIVLPRTQFVIGRDGSCHLRPVSTDVSKFHCAIAQLGERVVVRDLKSTNGTFLNGKRITGTVKAYAGDVLEVGPLKFALRLARESAAQGGSDAQLEWLMRSPDELENQVLDPAQDTTSIQLEQPCSPVAHKAETASSSSRASAYSEQATAVAGKFLREYMFNRKKNREN